MLRLSQADLFDRYIGQGQTQEQIAADVGVHRSTISRRLRAYGIPIRHGHGHGFAGFGAEYRAELLASLPVDYARGASIRELAAKHDISYGAVRNYLQAAEVTLRGRGGRRRSTW